MLARAAGVARHRVLRVVAVVLVVAYPFWANPVRVNASPTGWDPKFTTKFDDPAEFFEKCTAANRPRDGGNLRPAQVRVEHGSLVLSVSRDGSSYDMGGVDCDSLVQQYGAYDLQAEAPAGTGISMVIELHSVSNRPADTSRIELITVRGVETMHIVNGSSRVADVPRVFSDRPHSYRLEWSSSGFDVLFDGAKMFGDPKPSIEPRILSLAATAGDAVSGQPDASTVLPVSFKVNTLSVLSFAPAASASPTVARPPVESHHGATWWLIGAVVAAVAVITLVVVAVKRRDPRKLRPGHRK